MKAIKRQFYFGAFVGQLSNWENKKWKTMKESQLPRKLKLNNTYTDKRAENNSKLFKHEYW